MDGGMVRRSIERRVLGFIGRKTAIEESPPLTDAEMAEINGRHTRAMRYLMIAAAVLVVGGIAIDVSHGAAHVVCHGGRILGACQEVTIRLPSAARGGVRGGL